MTQVANTATTSSPAPYNVQLSRYLDYALDNPAKVDDGDKIAMVELARHATPVKSAYSTNPPIGLDFLDYTDPLFAERISLVYFILAGEYEAAHMLLNRDHFERASLQA